MTTYTYKCTNEGCDRYGELVDVQQSMHDDRQTTCPTCGYETFVLVIGNTQFLLKGDGWPSNYHKGVHHLDGKEKGMKK